MYETFIQADSEGSEAALLIKPGQIRSGVLSLHPSCPKVETVPVTLFDPISYEWE